MKQALLVVTAVTLFAGIAYGIHLTFDEGQPRSTKIHIKAVGNGSLCALVKDENGTALSCWSIPKTCMKSANCT